ncbi:hypothetical protein CRG98_045708 [Punica granatum]|uniref:TIR domain-containing protein n=1 Tax=Punica granatum TaxID=22663 RepID=A0A2I0HQ88_PUNGR|nr:hypothetical protein CRG98_045708 [Punica granatum]
MSSLITIPPELAAALSPKDMQRLVAEQLKELFHELILRNPNVLKQKVKTYLEPIFHFLRMNVLTYEEIQYAGIRVFRDNEEIRKGEYIGEEILRAIEDCRIFVPIFSRTYAFSKWCLIELATMVESKEKSSGGKKILPIFYDVSVDDVKLETELYAEALSIHREKFSPNTVQQWEKALREAGKIKGWELKDKGLVERIDEQDAIISLLDLKSPHDVRLVCIHGMGGIGKTTLARAVFNQLCDHFDGCCFLLDVRETTKCKGIEHLQRQLLQDVGVRSADITDENDGIWMISETLQNRKVLVVLDDVYDLEQIGKLAGEAGWFGEGSRIIITSRNKKVPVFEGGRVEIFEAKPMKFEESLFLFSRHAFGKENPPEDFRDLSGEVVRITGGLPLALEKIPARKVQDRLKISYDALDWEAKQMCKELKVLDLTSCHRLTKTPDLSVCTKLERLILQDCMNLVEIDNSVGTLKCLKYLNASGCPYLRDIPEEICSLDGVEEIVMVAKGSSQDRLKLSDSIGRLSRLKHLSVSLARSTPPNSLGYLKSLVKLDLSWSKMAELPKSIGGLVKLEYLSLYFCREIKELPDSIGDLKSLAELDISMSGITRLPSTIEYLQELKVLNMRGSVIELITIPMTQLKKLEKLDIQHCYHLRNIPSSIAFIYGWPIWGI